MAAPVWLSEVMVRALDLRLEIVGSIPAAALSSVTSDKLFTHIASELTTLWRYINRFK